MKPESSWVIDVKETEFMDAVVQKSMEVPVMVDFWAPWCGPCRALTPILEKVVNDQKGKVILAKVNIDENQMLAGQAGIESIPHILAFKGGRPVMEFKGALPETEVRKFIDQLVGEEKEKEAEPEPALPPADAEKTYREAISKDPNDQKARIGLAKALLELNKPEEIEEILEPIETGGDLGIEADRIKGILGLRKLANEIGTETDARRRLSSNPGSTQARYELGVVLAAVGKYDHALETLLSVAEQDVKLASTKIRDAMVKIFYSLGANHPLADDYRARLARLLY